MNESTVELYIYDISKGLAKNLAHLFLGGKQIDGIWHTGVVVFGKEFFFGGEGISSCPPCGTILGAPEKKLKIGSTQIDLDSFLEYLNQLSQNEFRGECYHLFDHNCNTFSDVVCLFLTGKNIPSYITNLPSEVMNTPLGSMLKPFIDQMSPKITTTNQLETNKVKENLESIFKTHYDSAQIQSAYSYSQLVDIDEKLIQEILEYLLLNDDADNFWNIAPAHIDLLCDMISNKSYLAFASMLLQMVCLRSDVANLIFKFQKSNFCNFLSNYETLDNLTLSEIILCMCNILSSKTNMELLSDDHISLFSNVCQHCLLMSDLEINLLSCRLLNNMLIIGKDRFDTFGLGVSLIELYNQKYVHLRDNIFMWSCFKMALELNNQLVDVCRAMQIKVPLNSQNQIINDIEKQINLILT